MMKRLISLLNTNQLHVIKSKMLANNTNTNTWNDQYIVDNLNRFSMFRESKKVPFDNESKSKLNLLNRLYFKGKFTLINVNFQLNIKNKMKNYRIVVEF